MREITSLQLLASAVTLAVTLTFAGCSYTPTNYRNIQEVDRLCAKDGGIRVYEHVVLSGEFFAADHKLNFAVFGDHYKLGYAQTWISAMDGRPIGRMHVSVVRKSDGRLLGEEVRYTYSYGAGEHASAPFHGLYDGCPGFSSTTPGKGVLGQIFNLPKGSL